jgi:transposase-like protein
LKEEKTLAQIASAYEVHPTQLKTWRKIALEGLPSLFEGQERTADLKARYEQQLSELYAEIGKLTTQGSPAQKKVSTLSHQARLVLVEREGSEISLRKPRGFTLDQPLEPVLPAARSFGRRDRHQAPY